MTDSPWKDKCIPGPKVSSSKQGETGGKEKDTL